MNYKTQSERKVWWAGFAWGAFIALIILTMGVQIAR